MRTFMILLVFAAAALGAEKLSPFEAVRFDGETPEVLFEKRWWTVAEIEGRSAADLVAFCKRLWPDKWRKRFAEDLPEVLEGMGERPGRHVSLVLEADGKRRRVARAAMTRDRRERVRRAGLHLVVPVSAADADADLKTLRRFLEERYAYLDRRPVSLDGFAWPADRPASRSALVRRIAELLAPFGDGHTRVSGELRAYARGFLPCALGWTEEGFVATTLDRSAYLDRQARYVTSLDGRPLAEWIDAARRRLPHGSPAFLRYALPWRLALVEQLRADLGLPAGGAIALGLGARTVERPVSGRPPAPPLAARPPRGVAYVRIAAMDGDPAFVAGVVDRVRRARGKGLVLDVRGNGGGSRDLLRALYPLLAPKDTGPRVVNVAKYRLPAGERPERPEGHLANRHLYPATWSGWNDAERAAIAAFAKTFRPAWTPPEEKFSAWHYLVLSPGDAPVELPVVVLMDGACFSATDIFLGALKGLPNTTLVGTPSGGGSGRARRCVLPRSGIEVRVSSMASFQPDGAPYDGVGVAPDVEVWPVATDWIGKTDTILDAGLATLDK